MKIFLSYASEDRAIAEEISLALAGAEHEVFFDRTSLPAGADFHARIEAAVKASDLVIFLISARSIAPGSYTLTELRYVRERWPHPKHRLLSVRLGPVAFEAIPPYLRSVTVLEPEGHVAAEVASAVAGWHAAELRNEASRTIVGQEGLGLPKVTGGLGTRFALAGAVVVAAAALGLLLLRPASDPSPGAAETPAMVAQPAGAAAKLLQQLRDANVVTSVEPEAMQTWLEHPYEIYRRIAEGSLALLKDRRLKDRANLDVIAYKYALVLGLKGVDDLPPQPKIDGVSLQKALVWAYNEENGAGAKSLDEIVEPRRK